MGGLGFELVRVKKMSSGESLSIFWADSSIFLSCPPKITEDSPPTTMTQPSSGADDDHLATMARFLPTACQNRVRNQNQPEERVPEERAIGCCCSMHARRAASTPGRTCASHSGLTTRRQRLSPAKSQTSWPRSG